MANETEKTGARSGNIIFSLLLAGFLVAFYCFFFRPAFFSPKNEMQFFPKYVPSMKPIGNDLRMVLDFCRALVKDHAYSYKGLLTPVGYIIYTPFIYLPIEQAYRLYVALIVLLYFFIMVWLPRRFAGQRAWTATLVFFLVTGLFSYGLHLEVERGQGSVLSVACCLMGIYLFHFKPRLSWLAYALFTLGVQLKIVPGIFILMFVRDWSDWKGNVKRFALIGVYNFGAMLLLGPHMFATIFRALYNTSQHPYFWLGNHSIKCFVTQAKEWPWHYALFDDPGFALFSLHARPLALGLLAVYLASLGLAVLIAWLRGLKGFNPYLLLLCTLGMMLIPAESQDYRLSVLGACLLPLFLSLESQFRTFGIFRRLLAAPLILLIAFAYSSTLFSSIQKYPTVYDHMNAGLVFAWLTASATFPLWLMAILTLLLMALLTRKAAPALAAAAALAVEPAPEMALVPGVHPNGWKIYRHKALEELEDLEHNGAAHPIAPRKLRRIIWSRPDLPMTRNKPRSRQSIRPRLNP